MTVMEFFWLYRYCIWTSFWIIHFTIARDPLRVIVLITSAFFWLLALLVSSILWFAVTWGGKIHLAFGLPFGLVFSVLFQELFRFLFYKLLRRADEGLQKVSMQGQDQHMTPQDISNKHIMAYVSGLGFGIISGAFSLINVLADMVGPGTIGIKGDSQYFFLASAFLTACFVMLHTFWGVIFFNALDKKQYVYVVLVPCSHMLVSCLTLLNQQASENSHYYLGSILPAYAMMLVMAVLAFHKSGGTRASLGAAFSWKTSQRYAVE